ncbi:hypothetical protein [Naasia lichenicola]|uniref:Uncharacterized protein n=1 Tax=Naasia lichenicola TaxID=2565933 RepID=A0A4S4FHI3_9MICO|nr:hypothetical protein [Naasia lichenicola]THG29244.1 hypothetical protein E6C64_10955 [Naasia lichenicola]
MPATPTSDATRDALASRGVRTVRAAVASSLAVFVALSFHVLGGGSAPAPIVLVAALGLALPAALLLIGRRVSTVRLGAVVVVAQALLHALFSMGMTGSLTRAGIGAHLDHLQPTPLAMPLMESGSSGSGLLDLSTGMTVAHLAAAGITLLALRCGEGAFWSLVLRATWVLRRLRPLVRTATAPVRRSAPAAEGIGRLRAQLLAWSSLRHRGPPLPL